VNIANPNSVKIHFSSHYVLSPVINPCLNCEDKAEPSIYGTVIGAQIANGTCNLTFERGPQGGLHQRTFYIVFNQTKVKRRNPKSGPLPWKEKMGSWKGRNIKTTDYNANDKGGKEGGKKKKKEWLKSNLHVNHKFSKNASFLEEGKKKFHGVSLSG